ncbi:hypothetical protein ACFL6R_00160 [Gemmatimonadota bacterium]
MRPRFLVLLLISSSACSGKVSDELVTDQWDSTDVIIVENEAPLYTEPLFEFQWDLRIGGDEDGPDWQLFASPPTRILTCPDGTMIFGDSRREEFYIVSTTGKLLHRLGGQGSGPGEFQNLWYNHWAEYGKEFWYEDQRLNRVTRFSVDGELLGTFNYGRERIIWDQFLDCGNRQWLGVGEREVFEGSPQRYSILDDRFHELYGFIELNSTQFLRIDRTGYPKPFRGSERAIPLINRDQILVVRSYPGELTIYGIDGQPQISIRKEWEASRVSQADIAWWKSTRGGMGGKELLDKMDFPDRRPLFSVVRIDDQGRIWVTRSRRPRSSKDEEDIPPVIDLFSPDGRWIGTVQTPVFPFMISGGYLYDAPFTQETAPYLERWKIVPLVPEAAGEISYE